MKVSEMPRANQRIEPYHRTEPVRQRKRDFLVWYDFWQDPIPCKVLVQLLDPDTGTTEEVVLLESELRSSLALKPSQEAILTLTAAPRLCGFCPSLTHKGGISLL